MGKRWRLVGIVLFPITIIYFILKNIYKSIERKLCERYTKNLSIERVDNLTGTEFEDFLYVILSQMGVKVFKTKASSDYGADLIVDTGCQRIAIQCKLYFKQTVGNSAIQEVASSLNYYKCNTGLVITNSKFSKQAYNLANENNINLMDRVALDRFLKSSNSERSRFLSSLKNRYIAETQLYTI